MKSSVFCLAFLLTAFVSVSIAGDDDDGELCACTALWDPVCGVDGKTYSNDGCAACAGVKVDCKGECPCRQCRCPVSNTPVCGNDGKTYPNACEANCKGVGVACESRCPCPCICIALYDPVCGTDGVTYGNSCEAGCKGVKIACEQECPCPSDDCICTQEYNPVCGKDGKTYGNPCMAGCAGAEIACSGECPCKPDVGCICPEIFAPVCGVDGVTYDNDCFAGCAKIPVDCQGSCPCPCSKGVAACKADPCDVETCPAVPDAKCFSNFCGGCNAIFVKDGKIVDCKLPSPSLPPHHCVPKDKRCNAFRTTFPSEFGRERKCCPGLECCPRCSRTHDSALTVTPVHGTCKTHCPDCK